MAETALSKRNDAKGFLVFHYQYFWNVFS